jgi:predicted DNA-binding transcriptional regulator AlpA
MSTEQYVIGFSEAAKLKNIETSRFYYMFFRGYTPKHVEMRGKKPVWNLSDIINWIPPAKQLRIKH